mmetsp:Transcript_32061/g.58738  ORF Transcript_32061/g.58738 Transcript_32061/m.58738 type:complete len:203 (+) Transcript_32061:1339-1947(+)
MQTLPTIPPLQLSHGAFVHQHDATRRGHAAAGDDRSDPERGLDASSTRIVGHLGTDDVIPDAPEAGNGEADTHGKRNLLPLEPIRNDRRLSHAQTLRTHPEHEPSQVHDLPRSIRHARAQQRGARAHGTAEEGEAERGTAPIDEGPADQRQYDVRDGVDGVEEVEARFVVGGGGHVVRQLLMEGRGNVVPEREIGIGKTHRD